MILKMVRPIQQFLLKIDCLKFDIGGRDLKFSEFNVQ
jgi:hypothetical protein